MLYTVTTKTPKRSKTSTKPPKKFKYDYHVFIVKAESKREIKDKFKASWPEHFIVDMSLNPSNIIEV